MSPEPSTPSRLERVLAYASVTIIAGAVLAFFVTLAIGLTDSGRETLATGVWPIMVWVSYIGLPAGFVMIMILLIINNRRRAKDNPRDDRRSA
jgi:NADH:ubiquinone oxidoreductase subunit 6 (subunit J)